MSSKKVLQKQKFIGVLTIVFVSAVLVGLALVADRISSSYSISPNAPASQPEAASEGCKPKCASPYYYCYKGRCSQSQGYCGSNKCSGTCTYVKGVAKCIPKSTPIPTPKADPTRASSTPAPTRVPTPTEEPFYYCCLTGSTTTHDCGSPFDSHTRAACDTARTPRAPEPTQTICPSTCNTSKTGECCSGYQCTADRAAGGNNGTCTRVSQ